MTMQNAIDWPEGFAPGTGDNFVSNEVIAAGVDLDEVWRLLLDTSRWEQYYDNVSRISFPDGGGPELTADLRFSFSTFGFPPLDARVVALEVPTEHRPGRLSWTASQGGEPAERLDVVHAWLVEHLSEGRVRVLTQEVQKGEPAAALAAERPNPMLNGHQAWLDGLIGSAKS